MEAIASSISDEAIATVFVFKQRLDGKWHRPPFRSVPSQELQCGLCLVARLQLARHREGPDMSGL